MDIMLKVMEFQEMIKIGTWELYKWLSMALKKTYIKLN